MAGDAGDAEVELQVVVRVIKADLIKNFEAFGKMDPFATVEVLHPDGSKTDAGRTRTDWNAHMNPVWNHTCAGQPSSDGLKLVISVWEDDVVGKDDLIGTATAPVVELLGTPSATGEATGSVRELSLVNSGEETGKLATQVMLVRRAADKSTASALTRIEGSLFESPVVRIGVSGGTAPFFTLKLVKPEPKQTPGFYIGKDLSHATDEIMFYEQLKDVVAGGGGAAMAPLLSFCFEYKGVLNSAVADAKPGAKPKDLLVLRNLFDGAKKLRLLDIKIGQKTADAGWQGKSRMAALRQSFVDGVTNSAAEGFRLEGFDGQPPTITSMDPLLDFSSIKGIHDHKKMQKKAFRYMLQGLSGAEMLTFFMDVHQEPEDIGKAELTSTRAPMELSEIVLSEIVKRVTRLAIACRLVVVPQKWIGSSVALGFDSGQLPARTVPEADIRNQVKVNIFDWGRSELNSLESHEKLSQKDRQDRAKFWCFYIGGIDRIAFEAARLYHNRFCNSDEWAEFLCYVSDFDSATSHDPLGMAAIPIKEVGETTVTLMDQSGKEMKSKLDSRPAATLTYSMEWRSYPSSPGVPPSRLKGAWRFTIIKANNLPRRDKFQLKGSSDPFVELIATSKDGRQVFRQQTTCKLKTVDPLYGETLTVPVAAKSDQLEAILGSVSPSLTKEPISRYMTPENTCISLIRSALTTTKHRSPPSHLPDEQALDGWQSILDLAVENVETLEPWFRGGSSSSAPAEAAEDAPKDVPLLKQGSSAEMMKEQKKQRKETRAMPAESLQAVADMSPSRPDLQLQNLAKEIRPPDASKIWPDVGIPESASPGDALERAGKSPSGIEVVGEGACVYAPCNSCKCM